MITYFLARMGGAFLLALIAGFCYGFWAGVALFAAILGIENFEHAMSEARHTAAEARVNRRVAGMD